MRWRRPLALLLLVTLVVVSRPAWPDFSYTTRITGAEDDLADLLEEVSQLKKLEERQPPSEEALRRRADEDLDRLKEAAHSLGYWNAEFSYEVDTTADPAVVTVKAAPGPLYHVGEVVVQTPDGKPLADLPALPLKPGEPARTAPVLATETALVANLGATGHPFAKIADRHVVVDHGNETMQVTYTVDPGATMRFGASSISGLDRLDPGFVERRLHWRQGDVYDAREVDATRQALIESGLFSTVTVTPAADPGDPAQARMAIEAVERAHRTIGAGLAYNTSEGAGARIFWENRNLFGNAEKLRINADVGQQKMGVGTTFRRPDFLIPDLDLLAIAEIANDTPEAYHSRRARASIGLERRFDPYLTGGAAVTVEKANVTQLAETGAITATQRTQHYALVGLPLYLKLDNTDDLLNPSKGFRAQLATTPYTSFSGPSLEFVTNRAAGSAYYAFDTAAHYIVAGALAVTSLVGPGLDHIPADKRIYAGGGGSIRAYGYQMAGALDNAGKPVGGKSSVELSLEMRIKITDTIGIVPFVDAGSYYPTSTPKLASSRLLYGPGLGFRYYTPFGPVRLDIAAPLARRHGDSAVQFYISLGQAF
jgi:translocation and assembly module TamA